MSFRNLLTSTVDIYQTTRTSDVYGTWADSYSERYGSVPFRFTEASGDKQWILGTEKTEVELLGFCEADFSAINKFDLVVDQEDDREYEVVHVWNVNKLGHHMQLGLREVKENLVRT